MKAVLIIKILRWGASILFYFLALVALVMLATFASQIATAFNQSSEAMTQQLDFRMLGPGSQSQAVAAPGNVYLIRPVSNEYILSPQPGTALNFYALIIRLVFLTLGMIVLWKFMKIFRALESAKPFKANLIRLFKQLALIFFLSELVNVVHYLVFNLLIRPYQPEMHLELLIDIGSNFITGLVVLAIAFVFERAVELQSENELTV